MNTFVNVILMGLGATLTFDLWGLFLKRVFRIAPSNICLVGRWLRYMPQGTFRHANIAAAPPQRGECLVGWMAHYLIGVSFAGIFIMLAGNAWLRHPTLIPALLFGVGTVLAPFLIMQPAFGFGVAASQTPNPAQARRRSLMNHAAFGVGLYLFGWAANWLNT
jgi:protein-S-isoprenylcysteine O-methyltransferase Ste14